MKLRPGRGSRAAKPLYPRNTVFLEGDSFMEIALLSLMAVEVILRLADIAIRLTMNR